MRAALTLRGPGTRGVRTNLPTATWPCPCDHTPLLLALPSSGYWRSRVQQPSSRLIALSPGDSCSKNSLGLIINQDEMRMTGCERQTRPASTTESRALSAHRVPRVWAPPLTARATWPGPCGRWGWRQRRTRGGLGFSLTLTRCAQRAHMMDGGRSPHPPALCTSSHAPRGEEMQRVARQDAAGVGEEVRA